MPMNRSTAKELIQATWWNEEPIVTVGDSNLYYFNLQWANQI